MDKALNLAGRILMAHIFVISGYGKIAGHAGTQADMVSKGGRESFCRSSSSWSSAAASRSLPAS